MFKTVVLTADILGVMTKEQRDQLRRLIDQTQRARLEEQRDRQREAEKAYRRIQSNERRRRRRRERAQQRRLQELATSA